MDQVIQTAALAFAGGLSDPSNTAATESYNGTSWNNTSSMATARRFLAGGGTQTAGLAFGGQTTVSVTATEEFTEHSYQLKK
jgi:hypothetical protein